MKARFTIGQTVRLNKRCVLSGTVPRNSKGYTHAVLVSGEGDHYKGEGLLEPGTEAEVIDYVSHGTGTQDYPVLMIKGKAAVCNEHHLDSA